MKKENILPGVVLTLVCAIVCGLLAVVNALTYDKIAEAEANKVQKSLVAVFGEDTYTETGASFEGVTAVYSSSGGLTIYDITADGYSKGGIRALIGIDADGAIAGVGIVSCGETAGVGTKITAADIDGWDSLMHITLISAVEDEFGVSFNMRDVVKMKNVGDMADLIENEA